jgi:PHD/YefM family antitoxin component YafN of YafNO toxin-antitoxin module
MELIPYRMLRNEPAALRKKLSDQGELIVTVEGKPFAIMIDLSKTENIEEVILMLSRLRAQMAVRSIRSQARRKAMDQLTEEEVEALIQKSRAENKG